jgi:hypothetical protein
MMNDSSYSLVHENIHSFYPSIKLSTFRNTRINRLYDKYYFFTPLQVVVLQPVKSNLILKIK